MGWAWLDQGFERISELHNPLLNQLIGTGRLRLRFPDAKLDSADIHAALLIGSALAKHTPLCLVLPDANPRRPAFLFAYALLGSWARLRNAGVGQHRPVLYCGVRPGIRDQLSHVAIVGLGVSLDGIFDQVHLARGAGGEQVLLTEHTLPPVITAFGPANVSELVETVRPSFVAVDLADAPKAPWLSDLLSSAAQQGIGVIAWSTNPLSDAVTAFQARGRLVTFPTCRSYSGYCDFDSDEKTEQLLQPFLTTTVRPIMLLGEEITPHDNNLKSAIDRMRAVGGSSKSSLIHSAVQVHWRLLRTLENLTVPFPFYEAEANHFWALRSISTLRETCEHFQGSVRKLDGATAQKLEIVSGHLDAVIKFLSTNEAPLWSALTALVHTEPKPGSARLLVFPSQARKELFLLALLAKLNITADDLIPLRTWITTFPELQLFAENRNQLIGETSLLSIPDSLDLIPALVGIPSVGQTGRLLPFFFSEEAEILTRSYQRGLVRHSVNCWDKALSPNVGRIGDVIDFLAGRPAISQESLLVPSRVALSTPVGLNIELKQTANSYDEADTTLWQSPELANEIGYLLGDEEEESTLAQDVEEPENINTSEPLSVDSALEVLFSGNWRGLFAKDQLVNYVAPNTRKVEERFVRSLRVGDTALIIPTQPRQSLYSLIISRVHQHPSIELHLALLRRWREDLQTGFLRWAKQRAEPLSDFLSELQAAGSTVTSTLALRFWLNGATLCPGDPDDLLRAAEVLNLAFVRSRHRQIANAAARIRGLHRGLSNRLNRWLNDQARGIADSHDAEVIDPSLGLTFGDLRSSLVVAEVESLREVAGPFLRDTLGYIERVAANDARRAIA